MANFVGLALIKGLLFRVSYKAGIRLRGET